jgi:hypothetical protein
VICVLKSTRGMGQWYKAITPGKPSRARIFGVRFLGNRADAIPWSMAGHKHVSKEALLTNL